MIIKFRMSRPRMAMIAIASCNAKNYVRTSNDPCPKWTNTNEDKKSRRKRHMGSSKNVGNFHHFHCEKNCSPSHPFFEKPIWSYWGIRQSSCGEGVLRQSCGRRHTRWMIKWIKCPKVGYPMLPKKIRQWLIICPTKIASWKHDGQDFWHMNHTYECLVNLWESNQETSRL